MVVSTQCVLSLSPWQHSMRQGRYCITVRCTSVLLPSRNLDIAEPLPKRVQTATEIDCTALGKFWILNRRHVPGVFPWAMKVGTSSVICFNMLNNCPGGIYFTCTRAKHGWEKGTDVLSRTRPSKTPASSCPKAFGTLDGSQVQCNTGSLRVALPGLQPVKILSTSPRLPSSSH